MVRTLRSPNDICGTPSSQPAMTRPTPMAVLKSPRPTELSNLCAALVNFFVVENKHGVLLAAVLVLAGLVEPAGVSDVLLESVAHVQRGA